MKQIASRKPTQAVADDSLAGMVDPRVRLKQAKCRIKILEHSLSRKISEITLAVTATPVIKAKSPDPAFGKYHGKAGE